MRTFEPLGSTQNVAQDGTAKTITVARASDVDSSVHLFNSGTVTIFVRVDGTTPTTSNALPLGAGTTQTLQLPAGSTTVKSIGASGTLYVTPGRGL